MKKLFLVLILFFSWTDFSQASYYVEGYVNKDGYSYQGGHWFYDGVAYTRTARYYTYYAYGKEYTAWYWYYSPVTPTVSYTDPDWRSKLLNIAHDRDKREGKLRQAAAEQNYFLEAVEALGLTKNFRWEGYGTSPYPPALPVSNQQLLNSAGKTVYGYQLSSVADIYGNFDLAPHLIQYGRTVQNAQTLAGQAHTDYGDLLKTEGGNRARVAEALARGQADALRLQALPPAPAQTRIETRVFSFRVEPDGKIVPVEPPDPVLTSRKPQGGFYGLAGEKCASCHAGEKAKGNFNVFLPWSAEMKRKVKERLETNDPKLKMPRNSDGTASSLTKEQIEVFLNRPE